MNFKILFMLAALVCSECIPFSSFWAPLYNPKILGYRVDIPFNPEAGKNSRNDYEKKYGYKGEKLIADLGNGNGPPQLSENMDLEEVKFLYTYAGANNYNPSNN